MTHVLRVGAKGRTVLPRALRLEVHVDEGDELIGRSEDGRIILETREAIKNRLRAQARAAQGDGGVVDRLLAGRSEDAAFEDPRVSRRQRRSPRA